MERTLNLCSTTWSSVAVSWWSGLSLLLLIACQPFWNSYRSAKACFVMTMGRLVYLSYWPKFAPLLLSISCSFLCFAIAFIFMTAFFCSTNTNCPDNSVCFCMLKTESLLCAITSKQYSSHSQQVEDLDSFASQRYCWFCPGHTQLAHFNGQGLETAGFQEMDCQCRPNS